MGQKTKCWHIVKLHGLSLSVFCSEETSNVTVDKLVQPNEVSDETSTHINRTPFICTAHHSGGWLQVRVRLLRKVLQPDTTHYFLEGHVGNH